jgi:uncharacterized protein GlcG (DUF336 family)
MTFGMVGYTGERCWSRDVWHFLVNEGVYDVLSHDLAMKMVEAAAAKAAALGVRGSVAVVDGGGTLKAFCRMDGSLLGSVDGAIRKAHTSAASGMSTATWFDLYTGNPSFGAIVAHGTGGMLFLPGGEPIPGPAGPLGGIGFSGGMPDQDVAVVAAAMTLVPAG